MTETPDSIYALIKSYEGEFVPPAPYFNINVGTFDVNTGSFTGLQTSVTTDPEPVEHQPGQHPVNKPARFVGEEWILVYIDPKWIRTITRMPAPKLPLQPALLSFSISHPINGSWSILVNGETVTAQPGVTTLLANAWDSDLISWTIQAGGFSHADSFRIQRPGNVPIGVAIGAFTIPALPESILYAPPADAGQHSSSTYMSGLTLSTTNSLETNTDTSTTSPVLDMAEVDLNVIRQIMGDAEKAVSSLGQNGWAIALDTITSQLGDFKPTETTGSIEDYQNQIVVSDAHTDTLSVGAADGGPGVGDMFYFLYKIQMAWIYLNGRLSLTPLSALRASFPAHALQQHPDVIGISPSDANALLSLDPFVAGGPSADLPADRFEFRTGLEYGYGGCFHFTDSHTNDQKSQYTSTTYDTETKEWDAGPILAALGLGSKEVTTTKVSNLSANETVTTTTITADLESGPNELFIVNVYYDHLFNVYAYQILPKASTPRLTGTGLNPGEEVTLTAGGKTFKALADQQGSYSFFSPAIPAGPAVLSVATRPDQPLTISPG